jgi:hypothetical protein
MKKNTMVYLALGAGILSIILAVIVFVFASGPRRLYSGIFFVFLGVVMLLNFIRWRKNGSA